MTRSQGNTCLRRKRREGDPMRDFDRLAPELRAWLAGAVLPWRPQSVQRAFQRALSETHDKAAALAELDRLQAHRLAKDALAIWGAHHPSAHRGA